MGADLLRNDLFNQRAYLEKLGMLNKLIGGCAGVVDKSCRSQERLFHRSRFEESGKNNLHVSGRGYIYIYRYIRTPLNDKLSLNPQEDLLAS